MVAGEIDLSIGSVYLFTPFMFYEFNQAGLAAVADLVLALVVCRAGRCHQRHLHRDRRRLVVHHDARHAARPGWADPDHLPRPAGRHAGRRGASHTVKVTNVVNGQTHAPGAGQRGRHVREDLRRRDLLRADLGAGDRRRRPGAPHARRAGACTPSPSAATSSAPARRASTSASRSSATSSCAASSPASSASSRPIRAELGHAGHGGRVGDDVPRRVGRGDRRHPAGRRRGHGDRRAVRRAVPRHPARRPRPCRASTPTTSTSSSASRSWSRW